MAVDRASLEICRGEIFTLLGPSGCGKTTTLRLVAGLERPDGGEIMLRGRIVASVPRRVFVVDELPLNASGKVLKYELRARAAR